MKVRQRGLYFLVLMLGFLIVIVALGGGLFNQGSPWYMQWQHKLFLHLCHQIPERSFWFNGQPMAVCSRCIGIYSAFAAGWMILPLSSQLNFKIGFSSKKLVLAAILINFIDIIGSTVGFWENTLLSRAVLGATVGATAAFIFLGDFFNSTTK